RPARHSRLRPHLAQAAGQLQTLQTPEGTAVPVNTLAELRRDMDRLRFVKQQIKQIEGLTGAPDESGNKRRERGLAKAGNARVRRGMIQLAWTISSPCSI